MLRSAVLLVLCLGACDAQNPVFEKEFKKDWATSRQFTIEVADAMPNEKYDFKVAPEEMSFGTLMVHIAVSQALRLSQISGKTVPFEIPKSVPKESAKDFTKKLLAKSFDFCIGVVDQLTPEEAAKMYKVDWYERPEVNGREMVVAMFVHTAHHRAQAEVYLRANGIKPPAYRF